ncbi:MAG TPA: AmmeMemoRadiSam system protein B [Actinomycetota bacterium]|nr:AmmeMemoRadiSam system protein B [Actinomycetota bacterium]
MGLTYGCVVPHSPNLVPEVSPRAAKAAQTREAMSELGMLIGLRGPRTCVVVSPHSPFLAEAFGVWDAGRLQGSMERFQAPDVTVEVQVDSELAEAIVDVTSRMGLPVGRMDGDWQLDRGITVPSLYLLKSDEIQVVPVSLSMAGWEEHWLFGTAIAKAAAMVRGDVMILASANFSHRVVPDSPHGYSPRAREFDARVRDAVARGRLNDLLDIPTEMVRDASECGFVPMLVMGGAFDGRTVTGRVLSYEAPFGIGYLVGEVTLAEGEHEPQHASVGAEATQEASAAPQGW